MSEHDHECTGGDSSCALESASNAELTEWFTSHEGDLSQQMHAAIHHVRTQHGGTSSEQWDFFTNQSEMEPFISIGLSVGEAVKSAVRKTVYDNLFNEEGQRVRAHHPDVWESVRMATEQMVEESPQQVHFGYMAGAIFSAYFFSGGKHCLWGIIDPELCQD